VAKRNNRGSQGANNLGKLRIIGGRWRSRQLPIIEAEGLRPTTDRVRETVFNWLQQDIAGRRCLDLFAGTGALGFEAASRGAHEVVMVEKNTVVYQQLKQNASVLEADNVQLLHRDAIEYLQQLTSAADFDIVFLDPPYQSGLLPAAIAALSLPAGAIVYVEANKAEEIAVPENWIQLKDKTAGQIHYCLYEIEN